MERQNRRKVRKGKVVSNRMKKSVVVSIERVYQHPLYRKLVKKTSKVIAHDEENKCRIGDLVTIIETRPLSKQKRWRVSEITQSAHGEPAAVSLEEEGGSL